MKLTRRAMKQTPAAFSAGFAPGEGHSLAEGNQLQQGKVERDEASDAGKRAAETARLHVSIDKFNFI